MRVRQIKYLFGGNGDQGNTVAGRHDTTASGREVCGGAATPHLPATGLGRECRERVNSAFPCDAMDVTAASKVVCVAPCIARQNAWKGIASFATTLMNEIFDPDRGWNRAVTRPFYDRSSQRRRVWKHFSRECAAKRSQKRNASAVLSRRATRIAPVIIGLGEAQLCQRFDWSRSRICGQRDGAAHIPGYRENDLTDAPPTDRYSIVVESILS